MQYFEYLCLPILFPVEIEKYLKNIILWYGLSCLCWSRDDLEGFGRTSDSENTLNKFYVLYSITMVVLNIYSSIGKCFLWWAENREIIQIKGILCSLFHIIIRAINKAHEFQQGPGGWSINNILSYAKKQGLEPHRETWQWVMHGGGWLTTNKVA